MSGFILYSMAELLPVIRRLFPPDRSFTLVEVGSEAGIMTRELADMVDKGRIGRFTIVEPFPEDFLKELGRREGISVITATSLEALPGLPAADVYLIDGDHNYYTVERETSIILEKAESEGKTPLLLYHDVCWPCDRRDLYYCPENIPQEWRQDHVHHMGMVLDSDELSPNGFRAFGSVAAARRRGGERNGVRTAIEDAVRRFSDWEFRIVPAIFGLGVVLCRRSADYGRLTSELAPYAENPVIEMLERNRIELFLRLQLLEDERDAATMRGDRRPRVSEAPSPPPQVTRPLPCTGWGAEVTDMLSASRGRGCALVFEFAGLLAQERPWADGDRDDAVAGRLGENGILAAPLRADEYRALRAAAERRAREKARKERTAAGPRRAEIFMELAPVLRDPAAAAGVESAAVLERLAPNPAALRLLEHALDAGWKVAVSASGGYEPEEVRGCLSRWVRGGNRALLLSADTEEGAGAAGGPVPLLASLLAPGGESVLYLSPFAPAAGAPGRERIRWVPWRDTLSFACPPDGGEVAPDREAPGGRFRERTRAVLLGAPGTVRNINPLPPDVVFSIGPVLCRFADWCVREMDRRGIRRVACIGSDASFLARLLEQASGNRLHVEVADLSGIPLDLAALGSPSGENLPLLLPDGPAFDLEGALASVGLGPGDLSPEGYQDLRKMSPRERRLSLLRELVTGSFRHLVEARGLESRQTALSLLEPLFSGAPHAAVASFAWSAGLADRLNSIFRLAERPTRVSGFFFSPGDDSVPETAAAGREESFLAGIGAEGPLYAPVWKTPAEGAPPKIDPSRNRAREVSRLVEGVLSFQEMWMGGMK